MSVVSPMANGLFVMMIILGTNNGYISILDCYCFVNLPLYHPKHYVIVQVNSYSLPFGREINYHSIHTMHHIQFCVFYQNVDLSCIPKRDLLFIEPPPCPVHTKSICIISIIIIVGLYQYFNPLGEVTYESPNADAS
jgi:hypothetical protein